MERRVDPDRLEKVGVRKGGQEHIYICPYCPSLPKKSARLEVNYKKGVGHCFRCGLSFPVDTSDKPEVVWPDYGEESPEVRDVPENLYRVFIERGVDPVYTISRYQIKWDGRRLCWPWGEGRYARRAVYKWDEPKVLMDGGHDAIGGEHLMGTKKVIVLCEGDWKAASIPLPWVGVFIGGTALSETQVNIIRWHSPHEVIVALDGGVDPGRIVRALSSHLIATTPWELPEGLGPDDIPMPDRIKGLLEVTT